MFSLKDLGLLAGALVALRYIPNASPIRVAKKDEIGALYLLHRPFRGFYGRQRRGVFILIPGLMTYRHAKASVQTVRSDSQSFTLKDGFSYIMSVSVKFRIVSIEQAVVQVGELEQILRLDACHAVTTVLSALSHDAMQDLSSVEAAALALLDPEGLGIGDVSIKLTDVQPSLVTAHLLLAEARKAAADRMVEGHAGLDLAHAIALVSWTPVVAADGGAGPVQPEEAPPEIEDLLAAANGNGYH
jgi:regulator of protease activity HflC (stomatin/prohibitin superfamily)